MNSETMTNFAKKAEEEYINLKIKDGLKPNEGANNAPQGNQTLNKFREKLDKK